MAIAFGQFERVAEAVIERTAHLLSVSVSVIDDRGVVVASSEVSLLGRSMDVPCEGETSLGSHSNYPAALGRCWSA